MISLRFRIGAIWVALLFRAQAWGDASKPVEGPSACGPRPGARNDQARPDSSLARFCRASLPAPTSSAPPDRGPCVTRLLRYILRTSDISGGRRGHMTTEPRCARVLIVQPFVLRHSS